MSTESDVGASDVDLLQRTRSGDKGAFGALMRRHSASVLRYAWALADDPHQAEDAAQETFLQLWKQRASVSPSSESASVLPWLLTTCRFVSYGANRRRRRFRTEPLTAEHAELAARDQRPGLEDLRFVLDELTKLSETDQRLCQLCLVEGRTYGDASALLGVPPAALRKRLQRARAKLIAARAEND